MFEGKGILENSVYKEAKINLIYTYIFIYQIEMVYV